MNFRLGVFKLILVFGFSINPMIAQNSHELHRRTVIKQTEKWKTGRIDDTRHMVDSFYHENGKIKEVVESIIKREGFRVVDSIPVNNRIIWGKDGNLVLEETFMNGKVVSIKNHYPSYKNLIPNGSFEQHSEIPRHVIEEDLIGIWCQPIYSVLSIDTVYTSINEKDTIRHTLITRQTHSGCDDISRKVERYVMVEKNGHTVDSVYVNTSEYINTQFRRSTKMHICNYENIDIIFPGWKSLGRQFPDIYSLEYNTPHSPLRGLADSVFSFDSIEGNSFVKLSLRYLNVNGISNCNPHYKHPLLQTKLNSTMMKGAQYSLEFWLWKPKNYPEKFSLNIRLSEEPVSLNNFHEHLGDIIHVKDFNDSIVYQWQKVSLTFEAPEFARYMTIGFFNIPKDWSERNYMNPNIWCYVDGFVLVEKDFQETVLTNFHPYSSDSTESPLLDDSKKMVFNHQTIEGETPIVLENIYFEVDSYELLPQSLPGLLELLSFLKEHPTIVIKVSGHTDDTGTEAYNKELSAKRAEAVVQKLIENGIEPNRLSWKGYGSTIPVAENTTDIGREKNRRVEFMYTFQE